jgi:hypothetical protein
MKIYKTIILPVVMYVCETWSLDIKRGIFFNASGVGLRDRKSVV